MRQSVVMYVLKVHSDILQCRISKAVQSQAKALPRRHDSPKLPGLPLLSAPSYRALTPTNLAKPLEGCTWYETFESDMPNGRYVCLASSDCWCKCVMSN